MLCVVLCLVIKILTEHQLHQSFGAVRRIDVVHVIREPCRRIRELPLAWEQNSQLKERREVGIAGELGSRWVGT